MPQMTDSELESLIQRVVSSSMAERRQRAEPKGKLHWTALVGIIFAAVTLVSGPLQIWNAGSTKVAMQDVRLKQLEDGQIQLRTDVNALKDGNGKVMAAASQVDGLRADFQQFVAQYRQDFADFKSDVRAQRK